MPNISNEQKLVNICFSVAMLMHDPEYADSFKKNVTGRTGKVGCGSIGW